ncbi:MAG: hypothetical protein K0U93_08585 [Gammaproteobacteria bacterium]|nr:hypothetical protein [Gammaproteobacteria bacterium]
MFDHPVVNSVAVPLFLGIVVAALARWRPARASAFGCLGIGAVIFLATAMITGGLSFPPSGVLGKYPFVAAASGVVGLLIAFMSAGRARLVSALWLIAVGLWLFGAWSHKGYAAMSQVIMGTVVAVVLVWSAMSSAAKPGTSILAYACSSLVLAVVVLMAGSLALGQISAAFACASAGVLATNYFRQTISLGQGVVFAFATIWVVQSLMVVQLGALHPVSTLVIVAVFGVVLTERRALALWGVHRHWVSVGVVVSSVVLGVIAWLIHQALSVGADAYYQ